MRKLTILLITAATFLSIPASANAKAEWSSSEKAAVVGLQVTASTAGPDGIEILRCNVSGAACSRVAANLNASSVTYTVTAGDLGFALFARETTSGARSDGIGPVSADSAAPGASGSSRYIARSCRAPSGSNPILLANSWAMTSVNADWTTTGRTGFPRDNCTSSSAPAGPIQRSPVNGSPAAEGGSESTVDGWRIHRFNASGTLVVNKDVTGVEYLLVGGGGGGGMDMGGGGGGGGFVAGTTASLSAGSYAMTVGAGGIGGPAGCTGAQPCYHQFTQPATAGSQSTIIGPGLSRQANGGGRGGSSYQDFTPGAAGGTGANGGGASGYTPGGAKAGGSSTVTGGFRGGNSHNVNYYSGGGGGAGGAGADGPNTANGGPGLASSILGTSYFFGGGGGGAGYMICGGNGGIGGGGGGAVCWANGGGSALNAGSVGGIPGVYSCGSCWANVPGGNAGQNTGGGGGGGSHYNRTNQGGNGGSGILIVRYPVNQGPAFSIKDTAAVRDWPTQKIIRAIGDATVTAGAPAAANTGGVKTTVNGRQIHTFTSSGTFTVNQLTTVEYLLVGGGGRGGAQRGGGGGAGGVLTGGASLASGTYTVTVGAGASGTAAQGGTGGSSSLGSVVSVVGGGNGGKHLNVAGIVGGSGGGNGGNCAAVAACNPLLAGVAGTPGQGNASGQTASTATDNPRCASGGGGAGTAGFGLCQRADGGLGVSSSLSGSLVTYGGGGGGSVAIICGEGYATNTAGVGGGGGGGTGGACNSNGTAGTDGLGGGGGAGAADATGTSANAGGSGVVILTYGGDNSAASGSLDLVKPDTAATANTGGTQTTAGGRRIHTFTSSGTFTVGQSTSIRYLIVGGGGGGDGGAGGGGGGGGVLVGSSTLSSQTYNIVVGGGGGGGGNYPAENYSSPAVGSNSTFNGLTATGGGYAGGQNAVAVTGGSGGGGGGGTNQPSQQVAAAGTSGQGKAGANGIQNNRGGGGGGARADASVMIGGTGAISSIAGTTNVYAGGGGAGGYSSSGSGGTGGGGGGTVGITTRGTQGTNGTGGGGGGGGGEGAPNFRTGGGGSGGSGIVIISYSEDTTTVLRNCLPANTTAGCTTTASFDSGVNASGWKSLQMDTTCKQIANAALDGNSCMGASYAGLGVSSLTIEDSTAPAVTAGQSFTGATNNGAASSALAWTFTATDAGSGVLKTLLAVDGAYMTLPDSGYHTATGSCRQLTGSNNVNGIYDYDAINPCPVSKAITGSFATNNIPDGLHDIQLLVQDAAGNKTQVASFTNVTVNNFAPNLDSVTISGAPVSGLELIGSAWGEGGQTAATEKLWYRCNASGDSCAATSETSGRYRLTYADVGKTIRLSMRAIDGAGTSAWLQSDATGIVTLPDGQGCVIPQN